MNGSNDSAHDTSMLIVKYDFYNIVEINLNIIINYFCERKVRTT